MRRCSPTAARQRVVTERPRLFRTHRAARPLAPGVVGFADRLSEPFQLVLCAASRPALRSPDERASPALLQLLRANAGPALHVRLGRADAAHSKKCLSGLVQGPEPLRDVLPLRVVLKQGGGCSSRQAIIPGLPVSRQTRAGLIKRQPNAGFLKPPWCQFSFVVVPGCLSPGKPGSAI